MSKTFTNYIRVRYGETDQMGYVYYGNYALYLEVARTELLRSVGLTYKELESKGVFLPVNQLNIVYKKAAVYDDELRLETSIKEFGSRKIQFNTRIFNAQEEVLIDAEVVLLFVNDQQKIISCPAFLVDKLKAYQHD